MTARAHVAQAAERVLGKDKVTGSNPVVGSRIQPPSLTESAGLSCVSTIAQLTDWEAGDGEGEV